MQGLWVLHGVSRQSHRCARGAFAATRLNGVTICVSSQRSRSAHSMVRSSCPHRRHMRYAAPVRHDAWRASGTCTGEGSVMRHASGTYRPNVTSRAVHGLRGIHTQSNVKSNDGDDAQFTKESSGQKQEAHKNDKDVVGTQQESTGERSAASRDALSIEERVLHDIESLSNVEAALISFGRIRNASLSSYLTPSGPQKDVQVLDLEAERAILLERIEEVLKSPEMANEVVLGSVIVQLLKGSSTSRASSVNVASQAAFVINTSNATGNSIARVIVDSLRHGVSLSEAATLTGQLIETWDDADVVKLFKELYLQWEVAHENVKEHAEAPSSTTLGTTDTLASGCEQAETGGPASSGVSNDAKNSGNDDSVVEKGAGSDAAAVSARPSTVASEVKMTFGTFIGLALNSHPPAVFSSVLSKMFTEHAETFVGEVDRKLEEQRVRRIQSDAYLTIAPHDRHPVLPTLDSDNATEASIETEVAKTAPVYNVESMLSLLFDCLRAADTARQWSIEETGFFARDINGAVTKYLYDEFKAWFEEKRYAFFVAEVISHISLATKSYKDNRLIDYQLFLSTDDWPETKRSLVVQYIEMHVDEPSWLSKMMQSWFGKS